MKTAGARRLPPILAFAVAAAAALLYAPRFGITWDDCVSAEYGELVRNYFASGFKDDRCNSYINLYYYSPLPEMLPAAIYQYFPGWKYEIRHMASALAALLAVAGVIRFAKLLPGAPAGAGWFAAAALASMPVFAGHAFINIKDVPFACAFVWSMAGWGAVFSGSTSWGAWLRAGGLTGLLLAVRPGGLSVLLAVLLAAVILCRVFRVPVGGGGNGWRDIAKVPAALAIAWTIMVVPWPWAHGDPLMNPVRAMREAASFSAVYDVLFAGRTHASSDLPRYYLPFYLLITTPPVTLALAAAGLGWVFAAPVRGAARPERRAWLLLIAWLAAPIAVVFARKPNIYDGVRHFLFLLPAVALFAGVAAAWGRDALTRRMRLPAAWSWAIAFALCIAALPATARLMPYAYTYHNVLGGGMKGAHERFETDYWVTSYREAAEWINANGDAGADGKLVVLVAANGFSEACFKEYAKPGTRVLSILDPGLDGRFLGNADYYVATTRYGMHRNYPGAKILHEIGRDGAVFAVIRGDSE